MSTLKWDINDKKDNLFRLAERLIAFMFRWLGQFVCLVDS
jgi:hypothetical protein